MATLATSQHCPMNDDWISVIDAAAELGQRKQHVFRILRKLKIESVKEKSSASHGQRIAYITRRDFKTLRQFFEDRQPIGWANEPSVPNAYGYFYLIQLEPEHDSGRFKVGFAASVEERLRSHKTAAPLCELIDSWPCKLLWEKTAIDAVTAGCEQIHTEVLRTDDSDAVEVRCRQFFALMPTLGESP
ncbi:MAG: GIY-YIG nuclease family protein [Gammaproteobacteria bacterium]|nr:GIY-YIG nuclease family protein [Gammaproteobacteria bacterium]